MTLIDRSFSVEEPAVSQGVRPFGLTVAAALRHLYPFHTAKNVARAVGCTPKAAESLLEGKLSARTATMLIKAFGPGWVAERVLEAAGHTLESYIRTQAEEARATAFRHQEHARELDQLETALAASRRPQPEGRVGRPS